jgi:predicted metal-dependent phosphoesterase TrpH
MGTNNATSACPDLSAWSAARREGPGGGANRFSGACANGRRFAAYSKTVGRMLAGESGDRRTRIMKRIKLAIHLHTHYSYDGNLSPAALVAAARRAGLDCIAITDHDELDGALEAEALGEIRVIIGEEISSADGHLIGLFLEQRIPPGLSGQQTIDEIHAQGGVALAPHPFCTLCSNSLHGAVHRLAHRLDGVEVFNAQNPLPWQDRRAAAFARQVGLPAYAGMDAHLRYLPAAYQIMPDFTDPASFQQSLAQAELATAGAGFRYLMVMGVRHFWDKLLPWPMPGFGVKTRRVARSEDAPRSEPVVETRSLG